MLRSAMGRGLVSGVLLAASAVLLLGCGDDDDEVTQEEFIASANEICRDGNAEIEEAAESAENTGGEFFIETVIPNIRQQIEDTRALGFPDGDEEELESILDDSLDILDQIESDGPESVPTSADDPNPFANVNGRLADYGLDDCV